MRTRLTNVALAWLVMVLLPGFAAAQGMQGSSSGQLYINSWFQTATNSGVDWQYTAYITFSCGWYKAGTCAGNGMYIGYPGSSLGAAGWTRACGMYDPSSMNGTPNGNYCLVSTDPNAPGNVIAWSNVTLPPLLPGPITPTNLVATPQTTAGICYVGLNWTASGNANNYYLQYKRPAEGAFSNHGLLGNVTSSSASFAGYTCGEAVVVALWAYNSSTGVYSPSFATATTTYGPVLANNADFIGAGTPAYMVAGSSGGGYWYSFSNNGTTTWNSNYKIGSQNPTDNVTWGTNRYATASSTPPGHVFEPFITLTAPTVPGVYVWQARMLEEGAEWFGELGPAYNIPVVPVQPSALTVSQGVYGAVNLAWTASPSVNTAYQVLRCTTADDTTCLAAPVLLSTTAVGATAYSDASAVGGQHYLYTVRAYHDTAGFNPLNPPSGMGYSVVDNAAFVSQSVPTIMLPGQVYSITQTWQNTGSSTWTGDLGDACGQQAIGTGALSPADNSTWGITALYGTGSDRRYITGATTVAPGQQLVLTHNIRAPATPGTYTFHRGLLRECTHWFGATSTAVTVTVVGPPTDPGVLNATDGTVTGLVNLSWSPVAGADSYKIYWRRPPFLMWSLLTSTTGTSYTFNPRDFLGDEEPMSYEPWSFAVSAVNSAGGESGLTSDTGYPNGAPSAAVLAITGSSNAAATGVPSVTDPNMATGELFTYTVLGQPANGTVSVTGSTFTWTPPAGFGWAGSDSFGFRVTDKAGATYDATGTLEITGIDDAAFVSQSVPATMIGNGSYTVTVTMRNSGATTWAGGVAAGSYKLGSANPADNTTWGAAQLATMPLGTSVAPGQEYTFGFNVTAPAVPGTYTFNAEMYRQGYSHFGQTTPTINVTVIGVPTTHVSGVTATKGTRTGNVRVTWAETATGTVTHYQLRKLSPPYAAWQNLATVAVGTAVYDDTTALPVGGTHFFYDVLACNSAGCVADGGPAGYSPRDLGWPNVAPISTTAALTATATTASAPVTPTVDDPNVTAGNTETYTFAILTQPAAGQGTASVASNRLVWTPPLVHNFAGATSFTYRATDRGGATVDGTATVTVTGVDDAAFASLTADTPVYAGQSAVATAVVNNTGTTTFSTSYGVGTDWPATTATIGTFRANFASPTAPLGNNTVTVPFTAPTTPGNYTVRLKVFDAGGTYFGAASTAFTVQVLGPPARVVGVTATQGTQTNQVTVSWTPNGLNTDSYTVYRTPNADYVAGNPTWTAIGSVPFGTNSLLDTFPTTPTVYTYQVSATNPAGEGQRSVAANGYANLPPTASSATLTATSNTPSAAVTPTVSDANAAAGQTEAFTFAVLSQPAAGTASVVSNRLVWTPPVDGSFSGATGFDYTVTDRGGATFTGTASVNVSAYVPAAPTGVTATQGTLTDTVQVAWNAVANAAGYNVYVAGLLVGTTVDTSIDLLVTEVAAAAYTVRSFSAANGESGNSAPANGWPNLAPTASTATLVATAVTGSTPMTPTVSDPNSAAGQTEAFTYSISTPPEAGEASVVGNQLVWTPAPDFGFSGTTTFSYLVTDRAGATVIGTATVNVAPFVPNPPISVSATRGTITNSVQVTWQDVAGAASYNVYRDGVLLSAATSPYDDPRLVTTAGSYTVRAVSPSGGESADSLASTGWANLPPTAVSAAGTVSSVAVAQAVPITVVDPNLAAGQAEDFTYAAVNATTTQGGTIAFSGSQLLYTAPAGGASGTDTASFSVTDKGGASVTGTATLTLCLPPALGTGTATVNRIDATVTAQACNGNVAAAGVVQYRADPLASWTQVATFNQPVAAGGVASAYSVARPVNARSGLYQTIVTLTDAAGQTGTGTFPFTVACPAPTSGVATITGTVDDVTFTASGTYTSPDVCGAPLTATLQVYAAADVAGTTLLATGSLTSAPPVAGSSGTLTWSFPALPPGSYRAVQTVQNGVNANNSDPLMAADQRNFTVDCPAPTIYAVGVSQESGLSAASGLLLMGDCSMADSASVAVTRGGNTVNLPVVFYDVVRGKRYYRFDYPLTGIANGSYELTIVATDGRGAQSTKTATLVVDRGAPTVQLTINGVPRASTGATAESLGQFGIKAGAGSLPPAVRQ